MQMRGGTDGPDSEIVAANSPPAKRELTATEAAAVLGIHERTVRREIARGALAAEKQSGAYRIA